jgi:hypothetical protein
MDNNIVENDNKLFKICKICNENLSVECFSPKRRMCKKCVSVREHESHIKRCKEYYYKNQEKLLLYKANYYYKKNMNKINKKKKYYFNKDTNKVELLV